MPMGRLQEDWQRMKDESKNGLLALHFYLIETVQPTY